MIITFYSYKGGVGRSMALVNIAELLYQRDLNVLIVDWDLEAPGLERFFAPDMVKFILEQPGVIDMLEDYKELMLEDLQLWQAQEETLDFPFVTPDELAIDIYPQRAGGGRLRLLSAGKRAPERMERYTEQVLQFDWSDFYRTWCGELYFEWLREQFDTFDVVLIDSRTGLTKMSGICAYQLADVVVLLCAPNQQNIEGMAAMAANLKRAEVEEARRGRPLDLLVAPARVDENPELHSVGAFRAQFVATFDRFMPAALRGTLDSFWRCKIPYVPFFAFNETVAVRTEQGVASEPLIEAFVQLTRAMAKLAPQHSRLSQLTDLVFRLPSTSQGALTIPGPGSSGVFHDPVVALGGTIASDEIARAQAQLARLPLDQIPSVAALPPGSRMLLSRNPLFVDREEILRQLATVFKGAGDGLCCAAVTGLGGMGKTQVAVEFVHRYGQYFAGGAFWLSFEEGAEVAAQMVACGRVSALNMPGFAGLRIEDQLQLVEQMWRQPVPRLLVFDNCEDEALLQQWMPTSGACRVLVTSRRATWDAALIGHVFALGGLPRVESVALLGRFHPNLAADAAALDAIAATLGDLPLALHLAGRYLGMYYADLTLGAYLDEIQAAPLGHPSLAGEDQQRSPTGHALHVGRTFAISYQRLDSKDRVDALARRLLARAAYLAPDAPILYGLLEATAGATEGLQARRALRRLSDLGLIEREGAATLRLHRLVAAFVREQADDATAQADVERVLLDLAERLNDSDDLARLRELQPHLRTATDRAELRTDAVAARLCSVLGDLLQMTGDYAAARARYERALAIREQTLGSQHLDTATIMNSLANVLRVQGAYADARALYMRALTIREQTQGPQHLDTARTLNGLGITLQEQGEYAAARPLLERALAIRERALGPLHLATARTLNNLATLLQTQGEYAAARPLLERALKIRERALGPLHPDTAMSLNNLAALLQMQGEYAAARPLYERALAIREQALGSQHPETLRTLSNQAALLAAQAEFASARLLCEQVLAGCERVLGPQHPDTARALNNLAALLQLQGARAEAHEYLKRALAIREQTLGKEHPETARALANLAYAARAVGDTHTTRDLYERALVIAERTLGPQHIETIARREALRSIGEKS